MTTRIGNLRLHTAIGAPQWILAVALTCLPAITMAADGYSSYSRSPAYDDVRSSPRYLDRYDRTNDDPSSSAADYLRNGGRFPDPTYDRSDDRYDNSLAPRYDYRNPRSNDSGDYGPPPADDYTPPRRMRINRRLNWDNPGDDFRSEDRSPSRFQDRLPPADDRYAPPSGDRYTPSSGDRYSPPADDRYTPADNRYSRPSDDRFSAPPVDRMDRSDDRPLDQPSGPRPGYRRRHRPNGGDGQYDVRNDGSRPGPRFDESLGAPGDGGGRRDGRLPPEARPIPPANAPHPEDLLSESQKRQLKITARYGNPLNQRFVQVVSAQQGLRLYQESMQLIDARHLQPSTYEARVRDGIANLAMAVESPAFQQANRVQLSPQQIDAFRNSLSQVASRPVQSGGDAVAMMQAAMDVAGRQAGIRPGAVALEMVNGATDSLDKYSGFIPEEPAGQPSAAILDDHVVGIGVEIKPHADGVQVKKVLAGGPAAEAGLQAGDIIVAINNRPLKGQSMDFAVDQITGQPNTPLQMAIVRGNRPPSTVNLVRRNVQVASVSEVQMLDRQAGIGYIKLEKFAKASEEEVDKALWTLHQQGMKTLVFDLRGNPGGLLNVAVGLADKFLPAGNIVETRGRTPQDNTAEKAHREQTWKTPLVVLVDGDSASASEIFAAAIQDNQRGVVVGRKSYGKGTVQTHFPLQTVSGYLKLTTAKFYSPSGREMAGQGVEPDVPVPAPRMTPGEDIPLQNDPDVAAAVNVARSPKVQEMASNAARGTR